MIASQEYNYPKVYLYRRIVQAKLFIDNHYCEKINLNDIAGEAYFSNYHFMRLFRMAYQKTPHEYLTTLRLQKARELLSGSDKNIIDICFEVGFESAASFTSLFKRFSGVTPSTYRRKALQTLEVIKEQPLRVIPG